MRWFHRYAKARRAMRAPHPGALSPAPAGSTTSAAPRRLPAPATCASTQGGGEACLPVHACAQVRARQAQRPAERGAAHVVVDAARRQQLRVRADLHDDAVAARARRRRQAPLPLAPAPQARTAGPRCTACRATDPQHFRVQPSCWPLRAAAVPAPQHHNLIAALHGGQAVRHKNACPPLRERLRGAAGFHMARECSWHARAVPPALAPPAWQAGDEATGTRLKRAHDAALRCRVLATSRQQMSPKLHPCVTLAKGSSDQGKSKHARSRALMWPRRR